MRPGHTSLNIKEKFSIKSTTCSLTSSICTTDGYFCRCLKWLTGKNGFCEEDILWL